MRIDEDLVKLIVDAVTSLKGYKIYTRISGVKHELSRLETHERVPLWTLSQVNRSFRRAAQATLWFDVKITNFREVDDIVELLEINPQAAEYIRLLSFEITWNTRMTLVDREHAEQSWWKPFCPDFLDWAYADREKILQEYEAIKSKELGEEFRDCFRPSSGPMGGQEPDPVSDRHRDPATSMKTIEGLIIKAPALIAFNYRSKILPLTLRACEYLRDLKTLEILALGTQGEMNTLKYPLSPLEFIFERKSALKVVVLSLQLSPSVINAVQDCDLDVFEGELRQRSILDKVEAEPLDDRSSSGFGAASRWSVDPKAVILPDLESYLQVASIDLEGVPYMDRPIVGVIRSLIAAQDQIGLLVLAPTCRWLCRMPQIIWLWLKVQVSNRYKAGESRKPPIYYWEGEPWIQAARALRPACEALVRRLGRSDRKLTHADVPRLLDVSPMLAIYRPYLADEALSAKVSDTWNDIVDTGHRWEQRDVRPLKTKQAPLHLMKRDLWADFLVGTFPPLFEEKAQFPDQPW